MAAADEMQEMLRRRNMAGSCSIPRSPAREVEQIASAVLVIKPRSEAPSMSREAQKGKVCSVGNCSSAAQVKGMCRPHYDQAKWAEKQKAKQGGVDASAAAAAMPESVEAVPPANLVLDSPPFAAGAVANPLLDMVEQPAVSKLVPEMALWLDFTQRPDLWHVLQEMGVAANDVVETLQAVLVDKSVRLVAAE